MIICGLTENLICDTYASVLARTVRAHSSNSDTLRILQFENQSVNTDIINRFYLEFSQYESEGTEPTASVVTAVGPRPVYEVNEEKRCSDS